MRKYYKLTVQGTEENINRLAELENLIKNMQIMTNPKLGFE